MSDGPDIAAAAALAALEALPPGEREPVFAAPWQAQAFALAVALLRQGAFSRAEWAETLGACIREAQAAGDPDTGDTYYHHWLAALERLVQDKGLAGATQLESTRAAWDRAAHRTPHGEPIELQPGDFA